MLKSPLSPISEDRKVVKFFTRMYAVALTIIAVVSIASQIEIQNYLSSQINDSHVINYAARLRTYSQTLIKTALLIESGRDIDNNRKEFLNTLKQWQKAHEGLQGGSKFLDLPANDRSDLTQMFDIIKVPHHEILNGGNKLVNELYSNRTFDPERIKPYVETLLAYEKSYLLGMELIVFDYDRFSRERVHKLKEIEFILLAFVLITLVIEAAVIFYPLSVRIQGVIAGLMQSEETSSKLAEQVQKANNNIQKSHNELREITFALEKATYLVKTDQDGKIIYANDKYCHVTKYTMSELRERPLFYNNMGGKDSIIYDHIRDEKRKEEVWQGEIFDTASDGTGFWLDVTLMPIFDNNGNLYQYMMVSNDITRRKNHEKEISLLIEEKIKRQDMEQKIRSHSIISGQEKERKRIAAEIHDGIGQMLTSLRMKIELVDDRMGNREPEIVQINKMLQSIINETKRICSDLLPSVLDDFGLGSAVKELIKLLKETAPHIEFILEENLMPDILPKEVETGVFRILQEALNNVIKHSEATIVEVHIDSDPQFLSLMIQDNGKGFYFNSQQLYSNQLVKKANGLRNMNERAELLGGKLIINSTLGIGSIIQLELEL